MRLNIKYIIAGMLASIATLSSCTDESHYGKQLQQTHDLTDQSFPLTVMVFDTESALNSYLTKNKIRKRDDLDVLGLAAWKAKKNDLSSVSSCSIYVVRPKGLADSNRFETWGHELVHCVYGSFHEEAH